MKDQKNTNLSEGFIFGPIPVLCFDLCFAFFVRREDFCTVENRLNHGVLH